MSMIRMLWLVAALALLSACGDTSNSEDNTNAANQSNASDGAPPAADGTPPAAADPAPSTGPDATDGMDDAPAAAPTETFKRTLKFSAIPSEDDATGYKTKFGKVAKYLTEKLGIPVEYEHSSSYKQSVAAFKNGYIHLAWFGGLTGVQARHFVEGARAIAQGKEDPEYFSYFIASADSGLEKSDSFPTGIKGKKFTFGSKSSTSGRLMPEFFIRKYGGDKPESYLGSVNYSGAHNKTAELVQSGQFDAGALSYKTYDSMVADGKLDPAKCKVIWKSDVYPDYNFTAHPDLDAIYGAGFTDKLQAAILGMKGKELLEDPFGRSGMIKATNEDFEPIRKLAKDLGFID